MADEPKDIVFPADSWEEPIYIPDKTKDIVFPAGDSDDSFEDWEQVARELETRINYLITEKAEKVTVRFFESRDISGYGPYGMTVEAFKDQCKPTGTIP